MQKDEQVLGTDIRSGRLEARQVRTGRNFGRLWQHVLAEKGRRAVIAITSVTRVRKRG